MKIGVEIAVTGIVVGNISDNLKYYDMLLVLCIDDKVKEKVTKQIQKLGDFGDMVKIDLLKSYFVSL